MLTLSDLVISFGARVILNGLSCSIEAGETVGIIGPNGSGKTTLFNAISGLVPLNSGRIVLKDTEVHGLHPHQRAHLGLGRVFQNFGIFREMTLLENVLLALESRSSLVRGLLPWSSSSKALKDEALSYLDQVGLAARAAEKAASLSGGQMRLLEIIRTLALGSDVFLLDEPTAGVSPRMKDDVANLIKKLQGLGKTVLIIEHDITFIQKFCGRIIVLNEGSIVLDNTPEKVRSDERLKEIYFGSESAA
jgi:ABC-type branched-subunit amino acid transport system ATPase component